MPDHRDMTGEHLLDSYDAATRLAADGKLGPPSRSAFALQAEAARAELLRRLRLEEARHPTHANVPLPSDLEPDPPADPES